SCVEPEGRYAQRRLSERDARAIAEPADPDVCQRDVRAGHAGSELLRHVDERQQLAVLPSEAIGGVQPGGVAEPERGGAGAAAAGGAGVWIYAERGECGDDQGDEPGGGADPGGTVLTESVQQRAATAGGRTRAGWTGRPVQSLTAVREHRNHRIDPGTECHGPDFRAAPGRRQFVGRYWCSCRVLLDCTSSSRRTQRHSRAYPATVLEARDK